MPLQRIKNNPYLLIICLSFIAAFLFVAGLKLTDKKFTIPFWVSINLEQQYDQHIKFYYDLKRGYNETDSIWGWSRNQGKTITYRTGLSHPRKLRLDFGTKADQVFLIQSACFDSLIDSFCQTGSDLKESFYPLNDIGLIKLQENNVKLMTSGNDANIELNSALLDKAKSTNQLSSLSSFIVIFVIISFIGFSLFILGKLYLQKLYHILLSTPLATYISGIICGLAIIACHHFSLWTMLGVHNMPVEGISKTFADWHGVLTASDCHFRGINVYEVNPCDPWDRVHVYGTPWLALNALGLSSLSLINTAIFINIVFLISCLLIIKPSTFFDAILSCIFILSPAILLGFERTNADLILFIFLYWAIIVSISYRDSIGQIISAAIIGFSTVLKIYPIVAITGLILIQNRLKLVFLSLITCILIIVLWYWTHPSELAYVLAVSPKPHGNLVFGGGNLFHVIFDTEDYDFMLYSGVLISIVIAYILSLKIPRLEKLDYRETALYISGLSVFTGTFYLTMNFDYRCIFFLMCLPALIKIRQTTKNDKFTVNLVNLSFILIFVVTWAEFPLIALIPSIKLIEQIITWSAMIVLIAICFATLRHSQAWFPKTVFKVLK